MNAFRSPRRPKRMPRLPVLRLPAASWESYAKALKVGIISKWRKATMVVLVESLPLIERLVEFEKPGGLRRDDIRLDSWSDEVEKRLNELSSQYDVISKQSRDIAAGTFNAIDGLSHRQWYSIAEKVMGVNLFKLEPWIENVSKAFIKTNVDLVTQTQSGVLADISRVVMGGFQQGRRWEGISKDIMGSTDLLPGVFQKVETRADLIARDQSLKLYASLGQHRQENAGIEWFVWRTVEDERVRGNPSGKYPNAVPSHYMMDGLVCKWNDPTVYAESLKDAKGGRWRKRTKDMPMVQPGVEINCRCYAEPIFETLFTKDN